MTDLLDRAFEATRTLPDNAQDDIARIMLQLAGVYDVAIIPLSDAERAAVDASKAAAARGEFATDEQIRAAWDKHGL